MSLTKELAKQLGIIRKRPVSTECQVDSKKLKAISSQIFTFLAILDFESTCWQDKFVRSRQEIIEFPTVLLNTTNGKIESEFHYYIQPEECPTLSNFCKELTGISQEQVDNGIPLRTCLYQFSKWLSQISEQYNFDYNSNTNKDKLCTFATWSDWDLGVMLHYECNRKQIRKPLMLNSWIDLRATYKNFYNRKPNGLSGALQDLGIVFEGREHSGLCDARNTARLAWKMIQDGCVLQITKTLNNNPKGLPKKESPKALPAISSGEKQHNLKIDKSCNYSNGTHTPKSKSNSSENLNAIHSDKQFTNSSGKKFTVLNSKIANQTSSPFEPFQSIKQFQSLSGQLQLSSELSQPSSNPFQSSENNSQLSLHQLRSPLQSHEQSQPSSEPFQSSEQLQVSCQLLQLPFEHCQSFENSQPSSKQSQLLSKKIRLLPKPYISSKHCQSANDKSVSKHLGNKNIPAVSALRDISNIKKICPSCFVSYTTGHSCNGFVQINGYLKKDRPRIINSALEYTRICNTAKTSKSPPQVLKRTNHRSTEQLLAFLEQNITGKNQRYKQNSNQNCNSESNPKRNSFSSKSVVSNIKCKDGNRVIYHDPKPNDLPKVIFTKNLETSPIPKPKTFNSDIKNCNEWSPVFKSPRELSTLEMKTPQTTVITSARRTPVFTPQRKTPPLCICGKRAHYRMASNPGPNQGRYFYSCSKGRNPKGCGFFQWDFVSLSPNYSINNYQRNVTRCRQASSPLPQLNLSILMDNHDIKDSCF